jgi:hypothetical protein
VNARRRVAAVAIAIAITGTGCASLGERKAQADRIIESASLAIASGTANLTLTQRTTLRPEAFGNRQRGGGAAAATTLPAAEHDGAVKVPAPSDAAGDAAGVTGVGGTSANTIEVSIPGVADLKRDRVAMLLLQDGVEPQPVTVFDGTSLYLRRGQAAGGAGAARPWARLDLAKIDPDDIDNSGTTITEASERLGTFQAAGSPVFLLRLLRGTLSGSVRNVGVEEIDGVRTTHYKMNVDREKATEDEPESLARTYEAVFKSMFVGSVVLPGEVWLDDQGLPRRFAVTFEPKIRRRTFAEITLQIDLRDFAAPLEVAVPARSETVRVEGFGSLANVSRS